MSQFVLKDLYVMINAVNLSTWVRGSTFDRVVEEVDKTCMGTTGPRSVLPGLNGATFNVDFAQDFGAGGPDVTLQALVGAAAFACTFRPTSGAISATNPEYQFNAILTDYNMGGNVGELATCRATFRIDGAVTRDITP